MPARLVKDVSDLRVCGHVADAKQSTTIVAVLVVLHGALVHKKRRTLG